MIINLRAMRIAIIFVILLNFYGIAHEIGHYVAIILTNNTFVRFEFTLTVFYTYWKKNDIISLENLRFIYLNGVLFAIFIALIVVFVSYLIKNYEVFMISFVCIFKELLYFMSSYEKGDGLKFILTFEHFNFELFYFIMILLFTFMWSISVIGFYKIINKVY